MLLDEIAREDDDVPHLENVLRAAEVALETDAHGKRAARSTAIESCTTIFSTKARCAARTGSHA
jgi:hypothetical protein